MNGNWLICWTLALSRYTTVQLMCWHVIERADKRLAGTIAVQTFIYQFLVLNKINRLTLERFEQKHLLLSGFTFEVVQISPASTLYSIHVWIKRCEVEHLISQGSAATEFRWGGRFYFTIFRSLSANPTAKELLKSVHICQSYHKNKSGTFFNGPLCIGNQI